MLLANLPKSTLYALTGLANSVQEHCGYVLFDGSIAIVPNIDEHPNDTFEMNPEGQALFVNNLGDRIIGMFHTHPRGICHPSEKDVANWPEACRHGIRYFIVTTREVGEFTIDEEGRVRAVQ